MPETSTQQLAARVLAVADADHALAAQAVISLSYYTGRAIAYTSDQVADHQLAGVLNPWLVELFNEATRVGEAVDIRQYPEVRAMMGILMKIETVLNDDKMRGAAGQGDSKPSA